MRPPDSSRAARALVHDAGLPMRMAVAIVLGCSTTLPVTMGAAPAAWKPHMRGGGGAVASAPGGREAPQPRSARAHPVRRVLAVALPVRGDVAGVADGEAVDVRGLAQD